MQPTSDDSTGVTYILQTAVVVPAISSQIVLRIDVLDVEEILRLPPLGQFPSTTFMTLPAGAIADVFGNFIETIPSTSAVMATNISADFVPPTLQNFNIDLTAGPNGIIQLTFSEPINVSSIDISTISVQNSASNATASVNLTGGDIVDLTPQIVMLSLSREDSNNIKALTTLAVSEDTTFVAVAPGLEVDFAGIASTEILGSNALQVRDFVPDRVRPLLESFELDLTLDQVMLSFSETVNISTFMPELITFQNVQTLDADSEVVPLTGGSLITDQPSAIVVFNLTTMDKDELRRMTNLSTSVFTTYITIASDAVYDMNANRLFPVTSVRAQQAGGFTGDGIRPTLEEYNFDLNTGTITLSFDETIDASSVLIENFLLEDSSTTPAVNYTLTTSEVISGNSPVIQIRLSSVDANEIKPSTTLYFRCRK